MAGNAHSKLKFPLLVVAAVLISAAVSYPLRTFGVEVHAFIGMVLSAGLVLAAYWWTH